MSKITSFLLFSTVAATGRLINGNWYADSIQRLAYHGVGGSGAYQRITSMDSNSGTCSSAPESFSGPLAPFDEDISLHFRGPLVLRQFAAYVPTRGKSKRARRNDHVEFVEEQKLKRAVGDKVTATINGEVVSWINQYGGAPAAPTVTVTAGCAQKRAVGDKVIATINGEVVSWINQYDGGAASAPTPTPAPAPAVTVTVAGACPKQSAPAPPLAPAPPASNPQVVPVAAPAPVPAPAPAPAPAPEQAGQPAVKPATIDGPKLKSKPTPGAPARSDWSQVAYFNSEEKNARGVTFLNNRGGQGSGVWDRKFGNSLSYASPDGTSGAASPEMFSGKLGSGLEEIGIFSDVSCEKSGDCGYVRPGSVAYKGFAGPQKAFFFEFMMPDDGTSGWNQNMPAIWALNGQIPRTVQYGACSCWATGCGEFDIFEVLDPGNKKCKSTVHSVVSGGSSDYFERPTDGFIKLAVIMNQDSIMVRQLAGDFDFGAGITSEQIAELGSQEQGSSIFSLIH